MSKEYKKAFIDLLHEHVIIYANDNIENEVARKKFIDFYNQPDIETKRISLLNFRSLYGKDPTVFIDEFNSNHHQSNNDEGKGYNNVYNNINKYNAGCGGRGGHQGGRRDGRDGRRDGERDNRNSGRNTICNKYNKDGGCRYGSRCKFKHVIQSNLVAGGGFDQTQSKHSN